jgi:metal-responsive CopG/Arc/MetJ family transcriptional regulator
LADRPAKERQSVAKIKLDPNLYERVKKVSEVAGYSSPDEFITHLIEKELAKIETSDSDEDVTARLRGLGYIE